MKLKALSAQNGLELLQGQGLLVDLRDAQLLAVLFKGAGFVGSQEDKLRLLHYLAVVAQILNEVLDLLNSLNAIQTRHHEVG